MPTTVDVSRYYRRALILPVVLSAAGFVVVSVLPMPPVGQRDSWLRRAGDLLSWSGLYAAVPYALFVAIVWVFFRPEGAKAHRTMAALAPVLIALSVALVIVVVGVVRGDLRGALGGAALVGGIALVVGVVHAAIVIIVVELVAAVGTRRKSST